MCDRDVWLTTGAVILAVLVGFACGWCMARDSWKFDAVKRGHAIHKVVDEAGNTEFEWLPPCRKSEEKKP